MNRWPAWGRGGASRTQGFSQEHTDVARKFGDQMTDIADSITRSGPLAAGADVNTMAGAADGSGRIRHVARARTP